MVDLVVLKEELISKFRSPEAATRTQLLRFISYWRPALVCFRGLLQEAKQDSSLDSPVVRTISGFLLSCGISDEQRSPRILKLFSEGLGILRSRPFSAFTLTKIVAGAGAGVGFAMRMAGVAVPVAALVSLGGSLFGLFVNHVVTSCSKIRRFEEAVSIRQFNVFVGLQVGTPPQVLLPELFDAELVGWACDLLCDFEVLLA